MILIDFEKLIRKTEPEIWFKQFDEDYYREKLDKMDLDKKSNIIFCMLDNQKVIARCDLIILESAMDFEKTGYIDWIYVEKTNRGNGFGKELINKVLEYLKDVGASYCYLFTAQNKEAQKFYIKQDYLEIDKKEVAYKFL